MAAHSSVLAWRIPGTGEPGALLSMGSHRVGHDWSDLAAAAAVSFVTMYTSMSNYFSEEDEVCIPRPTLPFAFLPGVFTCYVSAITFLKDGHFIYLEPIFGGRNRCFWWSCLLPHSFAFLQLMALKLMLSITMVVGLIILGKMRLLTPFPFVSHMLWWVHIFSPFL